MKCYLSMLVVLVSTVVFQNTALVPTSVSLGRVLSGNLFATWVLYMYTRKG